MVCMPFFSDQYEWAESVCTANRAGILVDKLSSGPEALRRAVADALQNSRYRQNAESIAREMELQARRGSERLQASCCEHAVALHTDTLVGVLVAAAVVNACLRGQDPHEMLPPVEIPANIGSCFWNCTTCCSS